MAAPDRHQPLARCPARERYEYQGPDAIGAFLQDREDRRGAPLRLVPTRANTQPAFGFYVPVANTDIARPRGLFVLTLQGDRISAITAFADCSVLPHFGLPRSHRSQRHGGRHPRRSDGRHQAGERADEDG